MMIKYKVVLSDAEHKMLEQIIRCGRHTARKITRSRILLMSHGGYQDKAISGLTGASLSTIYRTKRYFVEYGLEDAINDDSRTGQPRKLDANQEALLVATACTLPPEGCARWTLSLLGERLITLSELDSISLETIRQRLKEKELKPWQKKCGALENLMLPTLPAWKMFLICMLNRQTLGILLLILTRQANNLSEMSMNQNS